MFETETIAEVWLLRQITATKQQQPQEQPFHNNQSKKRVNGPIPVYVSTQSIDDRDMVKRQS